MNITKPLIALLGLASGGWMIFDGIHVIHYGKYFGPPKPGPWANVVSSVGIDPMKLGPMFVVCGILWLILMIATMMGYRWGRIAAAILAVLFLWYLPVGTVASVLYLILLWLDGRRRMRANTPQL